MSLSVVSRPLAAGWTLITWTSLLWNITPGEVVWLSVVVAAGGVVTTCPDEAAEMESALHSVRLDTLAEVPLWFTPFLLANELSPAVNKQTK